MEYTSEIDGYVTLTIGLIILTCFFFFGVMANSVALRHFIASKNRTIMSEMFSVVCLTDIITCFLSLFVGMSYLANRQPLLFTYPLFRDIWGSFWDFSKRYSVFMVMLIGATRAFKVACPFATVRINLVRFAMVAYALLLTSMTPGFHGITHIYIPEWCGLAMNKSRYVGGENRDFAFYFSVMSIPGLLLLPMPIIMISATVCCFKILCHRHQNNTKQNRSEMVQSAVTIILFTLIYIVLHIPYAIIYVYFHIKLSAGVHQSMIFQFPYMISVTHIISIILNATLNPILYYFRMKTFRRYVQEGFMRLYERMKSQSKKRVPQIPIEDASIFVVVNNVTSPRPEFELKIPMVEDVECTIMMNKTAC